MIPFYPSASSSQRRASHAGALLLPCLGMTHFPRQGVVARCVAATADWRRSFPLTGSSGAFFSFVVPLAQGPP